METLFKCDRCSGRFPLSKVWRAFDNPNNQLWLCKECRGSELIPSESANRSVADMLAQQLADANWALGEQEREIKKLRELNEELKRRTEKENEKLRIELAPYRHEHPDTFPGMVRALAEARTVINAQAKLINEQTETILTLQGVHTEDVVKRRIVIDDPVTDRERPWPADMCRAKWLELEKCRELIDGHLLVSHPFYLRDCGGYIYTTSGTSAPDVQEKATAPALPANALKRGDGIPR